jgi:hypothetical protein
MGETALDEQIFEKYLAEMRDYYTADKVCLLLLRLLPHSPHLIPPHPQYHLLGK